MANNQQPQGGNSMAALLGNMRGPAQFGQQLQANYGGGLQPPMMGGRGMPADLMSQMGYGQGPQPMQGAGPGGPMQAMPGRGMALSPEMATSMWGAVPGQAQARIGPGPGRPMQAAPGAQNTIAQLLAGGGRFGPAPGEQAQPMPSLGAPGGGAAGKSPGMRQAIGQLPGGPPMQARFGGALGNRMPRPRMPGMQPGRQMNPALMRRGR
jgi:hypothetical protein